MHQPRHHEAEELRGAGSDASVVVELDVHVLDGVQDGVGYGVIVPAEVEPFVAALGLLAADGNEELCHDVVENDPLRHHLRGGRLSGRRHRVGDGFLLILGAGDALLELAVGELGVLILVQVHAERLDLHVQVLVGQERGLCVGLDLGIGQAVGAHVDVGVSGGEGRGLHHAVCARRQGAVQLHLVELQGNKGEGKASVLREVEGQRHVQCATAARLRLAHLDGIKLAYHFGQVLARLAAELFPEEQLVVVELANLGGAHTERGSLEDELPDGVGPVGLLVGAQQHGVALARRVRPQMPGMVILAKVAQERSHWRGNMNWTLGCPNATVPP